MRRVAAHLTDSLVLVTDDMFPVNPTSEQQSAKDRLCCYRNMVFWIYPGIRRGQRLPLPACIYALIQATFPPTDSDEQFADWQFSKFVYEK